jgi:hypothetical protein
MAIHGFYRMRRMAGAAALLGVLIYAALTPLHVVSQAITALPGIGIGASHSAPCHDEANAADQASHQRAPQAPALPPKHCPFCQGFAAFQMAVAPAHTIGIVRIAVRVPAPQRLDALPASTSVRAAQSRGPPILLT